MKKLLFLITSVMLVLFIYSCDNSTEPKVNAENDINSLSKKGGDEIAAQLQKMMTDMNSGLASSGKNYRVVMAEYITNGENGEMGNTVLQKDVGNKQLSFDFVPFDDRRAWSGAVDGANDNITYAVDQTGDATPPNGGLSAAETDAIMDNAMVTWNEAICSNLDITRNDDFGIDIGVVANILSGGAIGSPFVFADVQHAGFRDLNFAGGVLGVTYTFGFTDANGFTDIDNNGKLDCAFREIYYDPDWSWNDDVANNGGIDLETVALHEAGHGLSQAHFGNLSFKKDGSFKASPRAVMNAFYGGELRELLGTDNGGHCSNWANWPNN